MIMGKAFSFVLLQYVFFSNNVVEISPKTYDVTINDQGITLLDFLIGEVFSESIIKLLVYHGDNKNYHEAPYKFNKYL